ncbi:hypothetical protein LZ518_06340 [Sphingomonas sp. RB56-2]|uniref:Uncharacterized protein n=1 Tax=Sphingomonas brevis TaxID=2908206 RepID=A0ABT0S9J5_9SPHN|nr:hypothetical protein [Sphingomonas brevis]MCL6740751.1 hypothetical protein [Sphingomonas brevis]
MEKYVGKVTGGLAIIRHFNAAIAAGSCDEPTAKKKPPGEPGGLIL